MISKTRKFTCINVSIATSYFMWNTKRYWNAQGIDMAKACMSPTQPGISRISLSIFTARIMFLGVKYIWRFGHTYKYSNATSAPILTKYHSCVLATRMIWNVHKMRNWGTLKGSIRSRSWLKIVRIVRYKRKFCPKWMHISKLLLIS